ncbi:MAG TPA: alpha/beta hydrolase [Mycobacteriales bacterium]|nr:alpha/beta hydrolase [Mycobacteriales bacterium]
MSWQLRTTQIVVRGIRKATGPATPARMQKQIDKSRAKTAHIAPSDKVARELDIATHEVDGVTVYGLKPTGSAPTRHVVYLHGGSYTFEISPFHWRFIKEIAQTAPARFTIPIYTLAPEETAGNTVPAMADLTEQAIDRYGADAVTLMGDSAGGGMALAVAQELRDRGKQPNRTVLISPWLDVTLSEPKAREIEPHDIMLSVDGLRYCGLKYAGPLDPKDPKVSPMFGKMNGLAPIDLFIGTHDIFYADVEPFAAAVKRDGADLTVHAEPKLPHVYPILPIPEGKPARQTIVNLVRG